MIPPHIIAAVLERTDIVALVSRYVELKKSGMDYKGRCPFHHEKTPSFYVVPKKRFYFCHGCRASGDAISFLSKMKGQTFKQAVQVLARSAKVALPGDSSAETLEQQALLSVANVAAKFFSEQLWNESSGAAAREFLTRRGLREDTLRRFGIGLAPSSWTALASAIQEAKLTEEALRLDLIRPRQKGEGNFDFFRNRIMVPLRTPDGHTVGFCGRLMSGDGPPLLYSKGSSLFRKPEMLFAWDFALPELRRRKHVLLLQGFVDCMLLHQSGVHHAIGVLSAPPPMEALRRIKQLGVTQAQVLLPRDSTPPDVLLEWARVLFEAELPATVAWLPSGETIKALLDREGQHGIEALLASSRALSVCLFEELLPRKADSSLEDKLQALATIKPLLKSLRTGLARTACLSAMAAHFGFSVSEIETELRSSSPSHSAGRPPRHTGRGSP